MSGCFCKIKSEKPRGPPGGIRGWQHGSPCPDKGRLFPRCRRRTRCRTSATPWCSPWSSRALSAKYTITKWVRWARTKSAPVQQLGETRRLDADSEYTVWNVAHSYGKTATFMPKPVVGDNGSGMHVHQSVWKDEKNLFQGNGYSGLSDFALYYIGGIIKHAKALNAITNPGTNSYKRLVAGVRGAINLAYSSRNRSAACRIPLVTNPKARRVEVRFPDATTNSYLAFAAMLMAGLDGVQNKIHPGDPIDKNMYDLPPAQAKKIQQVCSSLEMRWSA